MKRRVGTSGKAAKKPRLARARRPPRKVKQTSSAQDAQVRIAALERELAEAREEQTATAEVLKVISSSPGELQPVFQAMLENAIRICEAKFGVLHRYNDGAFHTAAMVGVTSAHAQELQ